MRPLGNDWDGIIADEIRKPYYLALREFLKKEYTTKTIYPPMDDVYSALRTTAFGDVKVVILGQDPYINPGEAHGMCFSVNKGCAIPPSLKNIFKELSTDTGAPIPSHGYLMDWARQGVLLLNTCLTVEAGKSRSHAGRGWETFTSFVIDELNKREVPIVFMLWGRDAQTKIDRITNPKHLVLATAHPSPLAGGKFFGCKHFSKANTFLTTHGMTAINWAT